MWALRTCKFSKDLHQAVFRLLRLFILFMVLHFWSWHDTLGIAWRLLVVGNSQRSEDGSFIENRRRGCRQNTYSKMKK